ncbi:hypothetical protein GCM10018954_077640 [Kutzneria kofuensis]
MKSCTAVGEYGVDFLPTSLADTVFQSANACADAADLLCAHSWAIGPICPASYMPVRCTPAPTAVASADNSACEVITMDAITSRWRTPVTRPTRSASIAGPSPGANDQATVSSSMVVTPRSPMPVRRMSPDCHSCSKSCSYAEANTVEVNRRTLFS